MAILGRDMFISVFRIRDVLIEICAGIFKQSMGTRNRVRPGPPSRLHILAELIPWNRFLGSLKVYKFGLRFRGILPLNYRSRSCSVLQWLSRCQQKVLYVLSPNFFCLVVLISVFKYNKFLKCEKIKGLFKIFLVGRIWEAQKPTGPADADPEHWFISL
jgi:hypothetical protein